MQLGGAFCYLIFTDFAVHFSCCTPFHILSILLYLMIDFFIFFHHKDVFHFQMGPKWRPSWCSCALLFAAWTSSRLLHILAAPLFTLLTNGVLRDLNRGNVANVHILGWLFLLVMDFFIFIVTKMFYTFKQGSKCRPSPKYSIMFTLIVCVCWFGCIWSHSGL